MNSTTLSLPAPAKLNLFLHITGRRANGYHELQTLFQFVDLCDELELAVTTDGQLEVTPPLPDLPQATTGNLAGPLAPHDPLFRVHSRHRAHGQHCPAADGNQRSRDAAAHLD